jgi:hypothetical protein
MIYDAMKNTYDLLFTASLYTKPSWWPEHAFFTTDSPRLCTWNHTRQQWEHSVFAVSRDESGVTKYYWEYCYIQRFSSNNYVGFLVTRQGSGAFNPISGINGNTDTIGGAYAIGTNAETDPVATYDDWVNQGYSPGTLSGVSVQDP